MSNYYYKLCNSFELHNLKEIIANGIHNSKNIQVIES